MYPSYLQVTVLICIHYIAIDHQLQGLVLAQRECPPNLHTACKITAAQDCPLMSQGHVTMYTAICITGNDKKCLTCQAQNGTLSLCEPSSKARSTETCGTNCTVLCSKRPSKPMPTTTAGIITTQSVTTTTKLTTIIETSPTSTSTVDSISQSTSTVTSPDPMVDTVTPAVVGAVGGLLILVVSVLIITIIWLTVVSQRKRNSTSRQNNNVNSLDNPTYNNGDTRENGTANSMQTTGDLDHTSTSHYEATEPVYHTLESPPESNNLAAIRTSPTHEYETMPRYMSPPTNENISTTNTDKPHPYEVIEIKLTQEADEPQDQPTVVTRPNASYAGTMSEAKLEEIDENNDYSTLDVSMQNYAIIEPHIHKEHTNQNDNNFDDSGDYSRLNRN